MKPSDVPTHFSTGVAFGGYYWFLDIDRIVDLNDLISSRGGGIIRVYGNPHEAVMCVPLHDGPWDFVAGLTSEDV